MSLRESIATTMDDEIAFADVRVASIFSPDEQGMEFNAGAGDAFHLDDIEAAMRFLWEEFNHGTTIAANAMYAFFINHTLELDAQELVTMARARDGTLLFGARQRPLPYHERYVLNLKIVLHIGGYDEIINPRETIKALIHVLPGSRMLPESPRRIAAARVAPGGRGDQLVPLAEARVYGQRKTVHILLFRAAQRFLPPNASRLEEALRQLPQR